MRHLHPAAYACRLRIPDSPHGHVLAKDVGRARFQRTRERTRTLRPGEIRMPGHPRISPYAGMKHADYIFASDDTLVRIINNQTLSHHLE